MAVDIFHLEAVKIQLRPGNLLGRAGTAPPCTTSLQTVWHLVELARLCAGGIQPKGADYITIQNCVVERCANGGIAVGFDPFWYTPKKAALEQGHSQTHAVQLVFMANPLQIRLRSV